MPEYVLDHHLEGEAGRLALMSQLLDPMHRRLLTELGVAPGQRVLEVGCGNGSVSRWLAGQVGPDGHAMAVDLDLTLVTPAHGLELRQADIVAGPIEPGGFDLVTARAVLHHVADRDAALANLVASLKPGGALLLIEPDFLPVEISEPAVVREFWHGWLRWAAEHRIDYHLGRTLPARLAGLGLSEVDAVAETALYNGGSAWAHYWVQTIDELRPGLVASGQVDDDTVAAFLAHCREPSWWTQTIAFTAVSGRA